MNKNQQRATACRFHVLACLLLSLLSASAQKPQDNWYHEQTWTKTMDSTNGGLVAPYGVAIGPDQRIYVGDEGAGRIQVYLPDGTFSFAITNGFGGGQSFTNPRGMITDQKGNLYVADSGGNCVFVFDKDGQFRLKVGGTTGVEAGQLSGVIDVGVSVNGNIYVLERGNSRVSVFDANGNFLRKWGEHGALDGQLRSAASIAVSPDERVYISQAGTSRIDIEGGPLKVFDKHGRFLNKINLISQEGGQPHHVLFFEPVSVRVDPGGLVHVFKACQAEGYDYQETAGYWVVLNSDLTTQTSLRLSTGWWTQNVLLWPCQAVGPEGSMVLCGRFTRKLWLHRYALREQWAPPRNAIPHPAVVGNNQRPNSPLVDIDYMVTDADNSQVTAAVLIFTNASSAPSLGNCLRNPTWVEGTATNLGAAVLANQVHRLTWNAGADWNANLGQYRIAVLARDNRPGLLDIHYVVLPAENAQPLLKISRSPLNAKDFMQVWWWLLATNDLGIALTSNQIHGVEGVYAGKLLCDNGVTTADGRAYVQQKMGLREASPQEVQRARQATLPAGTNPNQWPSGRSVAGRPAAVNEYGFDTGNWDPATCFWVVPLN